MATSAVSTQQLLIAQSLAEFLQELCTHHSLPNEAQWQRFWFVRTAELFFSVALLNKRATTAASNAWVVNFVRLFANVCDVHKSCFLMLPRRSTRSNVTICGGTKLTWNSVAKSRRRCRRRQLFTRTTRFSKIAIPRQTPAGVPRRGG